MLKPVRAALSWMIDGLSEAIAACIACFDRRPVYRIDPGADHAVFNAQGHQLGRLVKADAAPQFEPPDLGTRLANSIIDIKLPAAWVWRRNLQPIGIDSIAYLDAFVAHHVERISPWRASDVYHQTTSRPIANDPKRLAIEVGIVPRSIVEHLVAKLTPLSARLRLVADGHDDRAPLVFPVGAKGDDTRQQSIRRMVVTAIVMIALAMAGWIASTQWRIADIDTELSELDRQIAARKAQLAVGREGAEQSAAATLRAARASQPYVVELVDALSQIMPDHAYLVDMRFEKGLIRVSGNSARSFELVPALERSGRFSDVKFTAATTRLDDGRTDRFHLEMRAGAVSAGASQ